MTRAHTGPQAIRLFLTGAVLTASAVAALSASPARAVHQSHHGPFLGTTSQGKRVVIRVLTHTRVGLRVRWEAACASGRTAGTARFRRIPVDRQGSFAERNPRGISVRGKIGFDPQDNPAFPAPFSFAANEARGRIRVVIDTPTQGRCRSGVVTWEALR